MKPVGRGHHRPEDGEYCFFIKEKKILLESEPVILEGIYRKRGRDRFLLLPNGGSTSLRGRLLDECFSTRKEALKRALYILYRNRALAESKIKRWKESARTLKTVFAATESLQPLTQDLLAHFEIEDLGQWKAPEYHIEEWVDYNDPDRDKEGEEGGNNARSFFKCRFAISKGKPYMEVRQFDDGMNENEGTMLDLSDHKDMGDASDFVREWIKQ